MTFAPVLPWAVLAPVLLVLLAVCVSQLPAGRVAWARRGVLVLLVGAVLVQPAVGSTPARVDRTNLDVVFVVDNSPSVNAQDYDGTKARLDGVRSDSRALTASLPGARFSLISFGSTASQTIPFTTDTQAVDGALEVLEPEYYEAAQGSTLSRPMALLRAVLAADRASAPTRQRVVVLFSDGEQTNSGAPASYAPLRALVDGGAVLGYGTARGARMFGFDPSEPARRAYIYDAQGDPAVSKGDARTLAAAAGQLGVPYRHRSAPTPVGGLLRLPRARYAGAGTSGSSGHPLYWVVAVAVGLVALWEMWSLAAQGAPQRRRR